VDSKSRIGSTLIMCGTACIGAALGLAAFFAYLLSQAPTYAAGVMRVPIVDQSGFFVAVVFVGLLAGVAFVVVGVMVGIRQAGQTMMAASLQT
jgi:hypothetical protein